MKFVKKNGRENYGTFWLINKYNILFDYNLFIQHMIGKRLKNNSYD